MSGTPIRIDGSSTLYPLTVAVRDQFKGNNPNAVIDVKFSGTDAGFATFCKGELDVQDASRPIEAAEIDACRRANVHFVELPVAYDGLTQLYNIVQQRAIQRVEDSVYEAPGAKDRTLDQLLNQ